MILPGATIGILGGGQLGRMLATAAAQLGYRCHIYDPAPNSIAADVSAAFTCAGWHDREALARFAEQCDVVTYEFENVPVAPLEAIPAGKLAPNTRALEVAQDRLTEKQFVANLGGRPAAFAAVDSAGDLEAAIEKIGLPGILKTRREGYDGKGQWRLHSAEGAASAPVDQGGLIYEGFVTFSAEFSVILARTASGEVRFWDSAENVHDGGILATSTLPANATIQAQAEEARALARTIAEALGYVGVLTLEFFATEAGPVFNEMAPRVHNSGHWSIEGAVTSQFENHIRAICGLPLSDTALVATPVVMRNLLGEHMGEVESLLADPRAHLHLYGKTDARKGRKMGHVTHVG